MAYVVEETLRPRRRRVGDRKRPASPIYDSVEKLNDQNQNGVPCCWICSAALPNWKFNSGWKFYSKKRISGIRQAHLVKRRTFNVRV